VHSTPGPRKAQQNVEKYSLAAQVETSDGVENVDDEVDAHGTRNLQHGKVGMYSELGAYTGKLDLITGAHRHRPV
jgi:hypothetical protein